MNWFRSKKTVAVHDGHFHADDVFAVAILTLALKQDLKIIRTRDADKIKAADYALDIGLEYDPANNRFDHHQTGSPERENGIPYASAGLVWKEYGARICQSAEAADILDKKIIQNVDATDNGLDIYRAVFSDTQPYLFIDYIYDLNLTWAEERDGVRSRFEQAVRAVKEMLVGEVKRVRDYLESKKIIEEIYRQSPDKRIIVLTGDYNWRRILENYPEPLCVVRQIKEGGMWHVSCVPVRGEKFNNRLSFPDSWGGKNSDELVNITGVSDAVFCHKKLFMCSANSKDGAIRLAELAIKEANR